MKMKFSRSLKYVLLLFVISHTTKAQSDSLGIDNLFNLPYEVLKNLEVTVVSKDDTTIAKMPVVISEMTQAVIQNSGARNLEDVLKLVSEIEFNVDLQGQVELIVYGNWAQEGNVLLRIDGQEVKEPAFSKVLHGGDFSVESIKRVEIIREHVSFANGVSVDFGVINIITKNGKDVNDI